MAPDSILKTIYQALIIGSMVLVVLYFPINVKINAMQVQHNRDCEQIIKEAEILREGLQNKLDKEKLKLHLDPLIEKVAELKAEIKDFRQEIIKILTNKIN